MSDLPLIETYLEHRHRVEALESHGRLPLKQTLKFFQSLGFESLHAVKQYEDIYTRSELPAPEVHLLAHRDGMLVFMETDASKEPLLEHLYLVAQLTTPDPNNTVHMPSSRVNSALLRDGRQVVMTECKAADKNPTKKRVSKFFDRLAEMSRMVPLSQWSQALTQLKGWDFPQINYLSMPSRTRAPMVMEQPMTGLERQQILQPFLDKLKRQGHGKLVPLFDTLFDPGAERYESMQQIDGIRVADGPLHRLLLLNRDRLAELSVNERQQVAQWCDALEEGRVPTNADQPLSNDLSYIALLLQSMEWPQHRAALLDALEALTPEQLEKLESDPWMATPGSRLVNIGQRVLQLATGLDGAQWRVEDPVEGAVFTSSPQVYAEFACQALDILERKGRLKLESQEFNPLGIIANMHQDTLTLRNPDTGPRVLAVLSRVHALYPFDLEADPRWPHGTNHLTCEWQGVMWDWKMDQREAAERFEAWHHAVISHRLLEEGVPQVAKNRKGTRL